MDLNHAFDQDYLIHIQTYVDCTVSRRLMPHVGRRRTDILKLCTVMIRMKLMTKLRRKERRNLKKIPKTKIRRTKDQFDKA